MTLALDQITRVAERAATTRYEMAAGKKAKSFAVAIDGLIDTQSKPRWTAARQLRNDASHPVPAVALLHRNDVGNRGRRARAHQ